MATTKSTPRMLSPDPLVFATEDQGVEDIRRDEQEFKEGVASDISDQEFSDGRFEETAEDQVCLEKSDDLVEHEWVTLRCNSKIHLFTR